MKFSEINIDELTDEQVRQLILNNSMTNQREEDKNCVVVTLGSYPTKMKKRINLTKSICMGEKKYVNFMFLGGMGWINSAKKVDSAQPNIGKETEEINFLKGLKPFEGLKDEELVKLTEAEIMKRMAIDIGIPEKYIKKEWYSTNTLENMQNLIFFIEGTECNKVLLITSLIHLTRAKLTLIEAAEGAILVEGIALDENLDIKMVREEAKKIQTYIKKGDVYNPEVVINKKGARIIWPTRPKSINGEGR